MRCEIAEKLHMRIEGVSHFVQSRRGGVGGSNVTFTAPSRMEREGVCVTERQKSLQQLSIFCCEVLPFLYGKKDSPSGTPSPRYKICSEAICCILGVSRNFLYGRKRLSAQPVSSEPDISSVVDTSGVRLRQKRRVGSRVGYPEVEDLSQYNCGCHQSCFIGIPVWRLHSEYNEFASIARQLKPRVNEHRYLLNVMFCPLLNSPVRTCNKALSDLYTVSEALISDVRRVLTTMCCDPSLDDRSILRDGVEGYRNKVGHPMNRYPNFIREKVETHLDFILRADPGASDGVNTCRVYSPEVNTQEKLRKVLCLCLENEEDVDVHLSPSTVQRMINEYLATRNCRISFLQSDHNACPQCKTIQNALLQLSFEVKVLRSQLTEVEKLPKPLAKTADNRLAETETALYHKECQEKLLLCDAKEHNDRDAAIRGFLKQLSDHFRNIENLYRMEEQQLTAPYGWKDRSDHALITHQDDMTKVDLSHFILSASADITRWRYDVNAHLNAVTGDAIVFSHEQGTGPKNASSIMELVLLDHIIRCKGEAIKVIVSDNASVGKNWLTCVALPQYFVDQGLAAVIMVVFLENNHGKWLSDMLFGQLQTRKKRSTILGIDSLLTEFENVHRIKGTVKGFSINPLSSIDFNEILSSLGYATTPPKHFCFTKRNIHFATACSSDAKHRLPVDVRELLGDALPSHSGMVRISTNPPGKEPQHKLSYQKRYFDVPAADVSKISSFSNVIARQTTSSLPPLVVPIDLPYAPSGSGVVSHRTMMHVGYNGFAFRKLRACPELRNGMSAIVREAWPIGLLKEYRSSAVEPDVISEPLPCSETMRCAPENWLFRKPVQCFNRETSILKARYPPRNMLNAKFTRPPRSSDDWIRTATYEEPPFPMTPQTSAYSALQDLQRNNQSLGESVTVLDMLRSVFRNMDNECGQEDDWCHRRVAMPISHAVEKYRSGVKMYSRREIGCPKAPVTLRQAYKEDPHVRVEVERLLTINGSKAGESQTRTRNRIFTQLFEKTSGIPGGLEKYEELVRRDIERFSIQLKHFKEVTQYQFDRENCLLPTQPDLGEAQP